MGLCGSKDDSKDDSAGAAAVTTQSKSTEAAYQPPKPVEKSPVVETKKQVEEVKVEKETVSPLAASDESAQAAAPVAVPAPVAPVPVPAPVVEAPAEEVESPVAPKQEEVKAPEPVQEAAPVPAQPEENEEDNDNRESIAVDGIPKGHLQCDRCKEVLPKSDFSASQAKKKKSANCKKCVAEKA